jgi:hypothetical protein
MTRKSDASPPASPDADTPAWTDEQLDRAEFAVGGVVLRAATGTLVREGRGEDRA